MNEDLLEARGQEPLLHVIRVLRKLFTGESTSIEGSPEETLTANDDDDKEKQKRGFTAALAGSALAQTAALVDIDDSFVVQPWNMSVDAIDDMNVLGAGGTKVGEVEEVLGTDASTPTALVVDFDDNSTYGDDDRIIPLDQFTPGANGLTAPASCGSC